MRPNRRHAECCSRPSIDSLVAVCPYIVGLAALLGCSATGRPPGASSGAAGSAAVDTTSSTSTGGGGLTIGGGGGAGAATCREAKYEHRTPGPGGAFDVLVYSEAVVYEPDAGDYGLPRPASDIVRDGAGKVTGYHRYSYDPQTDVSLDLYYDPGPDGAVGTADDTIRGAIRFFHDASHAPIRRLSSKDPGPDGVWGSDDDTFDAAARLFPQSSGGIILESRDAGPNGVWGDSDDPLVMVQRWTDDTRQRIAQLATFALPGPDGIFGTSDDPETGLTLYPCRGDRIVEEEMAPGADGQYGTPDDVVIERTEEVGDTCWSGCGPPPPPLE